MRFLILAILFPVIASCRSEEVPPAGFKEDNFIEVTIHQSEISSAQNCNVTIMISYEEKNIPIVPPIEDLFHPVKVISYREKGERDGDFYRRIIDLTLDNLLPGDYLLNPILIPLYDNGILAEELKSGFIPLKVTSSLIGESVFIDDFEEAVPASRFSPVVITVLAAFFIPAAILFFFFWKRRKKETRMDSDDFSEQFRGLSDECDDRVYYSSLADLLREFLDSSIFLSVQSQTTEEFISQTASNPLLDDDMKVKLFSFFRKSDVIIFGNDSEESGIDNREKDKLFCIDFVEYVNNRINSEAEL